MINRSNRSNLQRTANMMPPASNNGGCSGCNHGGGNGNGSCHDLLHRLQALDFSIVDTVLYLDAYPNSQEALSYYRKLVSERDALKHAMANTCNHPVTAFENASPDTWDWTNGPWPWEASAN